MAESRIQIQKSAFQCQLLQAESHPTVVPNPADYLAVVFRRGEAPAEPY
jgi:hypothetical protein